MNCPIDKTEMEKGFLNRSGLEWLKSSEGGINKFLQMGINLFAYKCPKCGKVELTTEVK